MSFWKDESRVGTHRFIVARLNGCEGQPVDLLIRSNTPWPNTGHKAAVARLSAAACKLINDTLLLWLKGGNEKKKNRDGPMSGKQRYPGLICRFTGIERAWREPGWAHLTSPHRYDCCTMGSATGQITCAFTRHKEKACVCAGGQRNRPRLEFQRKGAFPSPLPVAVGYTKKNSTTVFPK